MKITIPSYCTSQFSYTVDCLFSEFLGLEYTLIICEDSRNVRIEIDESNLIIKDHFFANYNVKKKLSINNIPSKIHKGTIDIDDRNHEIVSLFGLPDLLSEDRMLTLTTDIISSTFYMLSRWEERLCDKRDIHDRMPAAESLAFKHFFIERPIVNEYVELLWAILQQMGIQQKRKVWNYKPIPTHDIDKPYLFLGWKRELRYIAGSIKRGRVRELLRYFKHRIAGVDPYDTYDMLMDLAEKQGCKAHFFFLQKGKAIQDESHEIDTPIIKKLIQHIKGRGHNIGFHTSYNAYNDNVLFKEEKEKLERVAGQKVNTGRNHFLRWDSSVSAKIWNDYNMKWDSTLGYADHAGFRCGVCYPFPLYDLENDRQLAVYERPLIAMEWSLIHYQGLSIDDAEKYIENLKSEVKKYNGEFVFLYHNSAFFVEEYKNISERLLNCMYK